MKRRVVGIATCLILALAAWAFAAPPGPVRVVRLTLTATPAVVASGHNVTFTGMLTKDRGLVPNHEVRIFQVRRAPRPPLLIATTKTNHAGRYKVTKKIVSKRQETRTYYAQAVDKTWRPPTVRSPRRSITVTP